MKNTINLVSFLFVIGTSISARGFVSELNSMIEETQKLQGETEARLVDWIGTRGLDENKTIHDFYSKKKLVEFIREAPTASENNSLLPAQH